MSLMGIDIGSSRCKAVVFSEGGSVLAEGACDYRSQFPGPAMVEMPPQTFWEAVCSVSRAAAGRVASQDPVRAFSLSSHGETFIPVDSRGEPVAQAIMNIDNRAVRESGWWQDILGERRVFELTGLVVHPMYPMAKIQWLRSHRPEVFRSAERFLGVTDYVLLRLGLPPYTDYSLASRFMAFDVRKRQWSDELLEAGGLSSDRLPLPVPAGTKAGLLSAEAAVSLGLEAGTLAVVGGHDQPCGALGLGTVAPGRVSDSMGTYECILGVSESPCLDEISLSSKLNSYCHVVPDQYVTIAYFPSGLMVKWYTDLLYGAGAEAWKHEVSDNRELSEAGKNEASLAREASNGGKHETSRARGASQAGDVYDYLESNAPVGPTGLCIAPHLIGTCNPDFNPGATGVIVGLRPGTDRFAIYKGILEGLACELAGITGLLARSIGRFEDILVTGGGSRSRLGLRLRAALTGCRLHTMRCREAVCLGGAMLAGVASGVYRDPADAAAQVVSVVDTVEPEADLTASYAKQVEQYRILYNALAPLRRARIEGCA